MQTNPLGPYGKWSILLTIFFILLLNKSTVNTDKYVTKSNPQITATTTIIKPIRAINSRKFRITIINETTLKHD